MPRKNKIIGRVHSIETLGTRDGPGLRCVFFLAGCNYRCTFCQNPDTWSIKGSQKISLAEAEERLTTLVPYLAKHHGGVTVSGGEPSLQPDFVVGLFKCAHRLGLSTALDTNGTCHVKNQNNLLAVTDLVMLDVKACDRDLHKQITGKFNDDVLTFGRLAARQAGRLLIRRVLLPGINDAPGELQALADYARSLPHLPEIEMISYHRLGAHKWQELGLTYPLASLKPPTFRQWQAAARVLKNNGLVVTSG